MKNLSLIIILLFASFSYSFGQKIVKTIKSEVTEASLESKLRFLASDELRGRDTGSPELDIAALYIAENFRSYGLKVPNGMSDYFQPVKLVENSPVDKVVVALGGQVAKKNEDILFLDGSDGDFKGDLVFMNYGLEADYNGKSVKGKIVMVLPGDDKTKDPRQYLPLSSKKQQLAQKNGAIGVVELYKNATTPWRLVVNALSRPGMQLDLNEDSSGKPIFLAWLSDLDGKWENMIREGQTSGRVSLKGAGKKKIASKNVIGWVEGKHPEKKNEFLVMTAHYDHVGVRFTEPEQDSIFNGARDNAIGVATLLETAKLLSENKPDYSVVLIAFTAEEKGLLGSIWYAEKPVFPLNKTFFNFNTDGGGYNSTSIATVVGLNRTGVTDNLKKSVRPFGLGVTDDPAPEQNLFDRSDNVSFAKKGIPALTFSCGMTAFDAEIMKFYHQASDEVSSMDMAYLVNYARSFVYAAYLIANSKEKPFWNKGDKYEEVGKALYGIK